ncbi:MAG: cellulase N-terminal Ig-like domain-containing protein [Segetibacter sp.]
MKKDFSIILMLLLFTFTSSFRNEEPQVAWIRINLLGYIPNGIKVAVWASKTKEVPKEFQLVEFSNRQSCLYR